jgi:hypothetical protein
LHHGIFTTTCQRPSLRTHPREKSKRVATNLLIDDDDDDVGTKRAMKAAG